MTKMEERIRALEDALAIAQAQESDKPHTLLSTPWKVDDDEEEQPHEPTNPGLEDLVAGAVCIRALGTREEEVARARVEINWRIDLVMDQKSNTGSGHYL